MASGYRCRFAFLVLLFLLYLLYFLYICCLYIYLLYIYLLWYLLHFLYFLHLLYCQENIRWYPGRGKLLCPLWPCGAVVHWCLPFPADIRIQYQINSLEKNNSKKQNPILEALLKKRKSQQSAWFCKTTKVIGAMPESKLISLCCLPWWDYVWC